MLGPIITLFAVNAMVVSLKNLWGFTVTKMEPLDLICLTKMGLLRRENDGSFQVVPANPFVPRAEKTTSKEIGQATASSPPPPSSDEWEKLIAENAELQVCKAFTERYPIKYSKFLEEYNSSEAQKH